MKRKISVLEREISTTAFVVSVVVFLFLTVASGGYVAQYRADRGESAVPQKTQEAVLGQTSEVDQYCYNINPNAHESWQFNGYYREQSFIPTLDTLTKVNLTLGGVNLNGNTPLRLVVLTPGKAIIGQKTIYPTLNQMWGVDFSFSQPITVTPGNTYYLRVELMDSTDDSWIYWYTGGSAYGNGQAFESGEPMPYDFAFITYGYNYEEPVDETKTTPISSNQTTNKTNTTTPGAPVVPASQLAVPANFRVDRNQDEQIVFSWDKNTEADLVGYKLYIYEAGSEAELEVVDIDDKELDNYNLALADHSKLSLGKEYSVRLSAKNTAGAVSEKTPALQVSFTAKGALAVEGARSNWLTNPYVLGGLGLLMLALIGLLIFLERRFHGLGKLLQRDKS